MPDMLAQLSPEGLKKVAESLAQMKKILDDKEAAKRMGFFTDAQLAEIQTVYDNTKRTYDFYAPKSIVTK